VDKINSKIRNEGRGESVGYDEVLSIASGAVSRLHIGRVLVSKGIARNIPDAFKRYLVPCDVPKRYFAMEDAIAEIRRVNGVSVLAHPPSIKAERHVVRQLIAQWQEMGLDGIEVFNKLCYKDDMIFYRSLATELKLLTSGGSDYHGYEDDVEMGTGSGGLEIPYSVLENLRSRISAQPTDVGSRP
jgi:predicted metal-dependent phosphoesterase TrpH